MLSFRKFYLQVHQFFQEHYLRIWFVSIFTLILVGFFHFELKKNNRDLIYWRDMLSYVYNDMENFALIVIMLLLLLKIIFVCLVIAMNRKSHNWIDELSQLEVKKRYADFLFLRLIADIDKVQAKYLRNNRTSEIIALRSFIMAHDDMTKKIEKFRKDARKLLTPNEMEISLPIEDVYVMDEDEDRTVRRSKFYNMDISANDEMIKKLLNP